MRKFYSITKTTKNIAALICAAIFARVLLGGSSRLTDTETMEALAVQTSLFTTDDISISAASAILIDASSKRVIFEKDASSRRPMASTTKIMTALIALEAGDLARTVSVSEEAVGVEGSSVYLSSGDRLTLDDLIWALMLESANDAAAAIAIEVAGSVDGFAELMNKRAAELGLCDTHFTNPHGLDDEAHYTTARDLSMLAAYALKDPTFREIVSTYKHSINVGDETRSLLNHNKLLKQYDGAIGVKTGYTKRSGRCLVSAAERDGVELIAVTLDAPDDWNDHRIMLDYGFELLESRDIIAEGGSVFILPCIGGEKNELMVKNTEGLTLCLPKTAPEVVWHIELPRYIWGGAKEGETIGRIIFELDGEELGEVELAAAETVDRLKYDSGLLKKLLGQS